jgi:phosphinothricin acetyltransferase
MHASSIRLATADDFAAIAAITNHYIRTTAIHFGSEEQTAEELRALWQEHEDVYPWLVAGDGGEVLAYAKAGVWRGRPAYRWTPESGLYVHHEHLGQGLGKPLYARLLDLLRAQGFHSVMAGATLPNPASERLHQSLGFETVGIVRQAGFKFGRWHDVVFWQRRLADAGTPGGTIRSPREAWQALASSDP